MSACEAALLPEQGRARLAASVEERSVAAQAAATRLAALETKLARLARPDVAVATASRNAAAEAARPAGDGAVNLQRDLGDISDREKRVGELAARLGDLERRLEVGALSGGESFLASLRIPGPPPPASRALS